MSLHILCIYTIQILKHGKVLVFHERPESATIKYFYSLRIILHCKPSRKMRGRKGVCPPVLLQTRFKIPEINGIPSPFPALQVHNQQVTPHLQN